MIVRPDGDGLIIIRQADHAALAAEIAKAWHPPRKPKQRPHNSLLVAAEHHDAGWRDWEERTPNPLDEAGRPRDFMHMPLDDHLEVWQASVDRAMQYDLYAGLLVSLHATALYEGRLATRADTPQERTKIRAFVAEQVAWREGMHPLLEGRPFYAGRLSEEGLAADLRLLQTWDTLSLMLCVPWTDARTFDGVHLPGGEVDTLKVSVPGESVLALNPYPLHDDPFTVTVKGRRLPRRQFANAPALAEAYVAATRVELSFALRSI